MEVFAESTYFYFGCPCLRSCQDHHTRRAKPLIDTQSPYIRAIRDQKTVWDTCPPSCQALIPWFIRHQFADTVTPL